MELKFSRCDFQILSELDQLTDYNSYGQYLYEAIEYTYFGLGVFWFDQSISGGK